MPAPKKTSTAKAAAQTNIENVGGVVVRKRGRPKKVAIIPETEKEAEENGNAQKLGNEYEKADDIAPEGVVGAGETQLQGNKGDTELEYNGTQAPKTRSGRQINESRASHP